MPSSAEKIIPIEQSDCCGNGCANCVLDEKSQPASNSFSASGKLNVILNYCNFRLLSKEPHCESCGDVLELHFRCAQLTTQASDYMLDIPPGHHIMMRAPLLPEPNQHLRPYSPFWTDATAMEFKILVNLKPRGRMSQFIADLKIGDKVEFRGPIGNHVHEANSDGTKSICIVSQGVAVAPTLRLVEKILHDDNDMTRICHLACFTDLQHVYFRQPLHDFNRYWNYKGRVYLARQPCRGGCCKDLCTESCVDFLKSLRYKEVMLLRRINSAEISKACDSCSESREHLFIISGSRDFQRTIVDEIGRMEIILRNENIILL